MDDDLLDPLRLLIVGINYSDWISGYIIVYGLYGFDGDVFFGVPESETES
jgi:hypothetical protein